MGATGVIEEIWTKDCLEELLLGKGMRRSSSGGNRMFRGRGGVVEANEWTS